MNQNPYIGLRPFESKDSLNFFGRQKQIVELLERLHQYKFLAVVGSSGSGKSSLIRAGLIPRLQAGYLVEDRSDWISVIMKPGQNPLFHLAGAILESRDSDSDTETLKNEIKEVGVDGILDFLRPLFKDKDKNFLLLVDQFEELFRFASGEGESSSDGQDDEAIDFVNLLLALSEQEELPIYVAITMRSDFIGDCVKFYGLPEALNRSQYLVPRLNRVQRKSAIEGPAKLIGEKINSSLVSKLLNDVESEQDELPLLQHALMRVWDYEKSQDQNGELDLDDYRNIGGLKKALSQHADEIIEDLSKEDLLLVKKMFQALTMIDENGRKIRRPCRLSELVSVTKSNNKKLISLIEEFIKEGRSFLVRSSVENDPNDEMIDISHESLIRQWGTLQKWVDDESKAAETYLNLTRSLELNKEGKRNFLSELEILEVRNWKETFNPEESWSSRYDSHFNEAIEFYDNSEAALADLKEQERIAENRRKKLKRVTWVAVVIGILAFFSVIVGIYAFVQTGVANEQRAEAEKQTGEAKRQTELALEARKESDLARAEAVVQKQKADSIAAIAREQERFANDARVDAEGAKEKADENARTAQRQTARAQRAQKVAEAARHEVEELKESYRLITSAIGEIDPSISIRIAQEANKVGSDSLINDLTYKIFRENNFYKELPFQVNDDSYYELKLFNSKIWVLDSESGVLTSYDLKGNILQTFGESFVNGFDVSPDGENVITGEDDNTARIWNSEGQILAELDDHDASVYNVKFSPRGNKVITGTYSDHARIWNLNGTLNQTIKVDDGFSRGSFSPSEKYLAISDGETGFIYKKQGIKYILQNSITREASGIENLAYVDENLLILESIDYPSEQTITILVDPLKEDTIKSFGASTFLSASEKHILTSDFYNLSIYHKETNTSEQIPGSTLGGYLASAAVSPNGKMMASIDEGGMKLWDLKGTTEAEFSFLESEFYMERADYSPVNNKLLIKSFQSVSLVDADNLRNPKVVSTQSGQDVNFTADERFLFYPKENKIKVQSISDESEFEFQAHHSIIHATGPTANNQIVTISEDTVRLWEVDGTIVRETVLTKSTDINKISISRDNEKILTISNDRFKIFDWNGNEMRSHEIDQDSYAFFIDAEFYGDEIIAIDSRYNLHRVPIEMEPEAYSFAEPSNSEDDDPWLQEDFSFEEPWAGSPFSKSIEYNNSYYCDYADVHPETGQSIVYYDDKIGLLDSEGNLLHLFYPSMVGYIVGLNFSSDGTKIIAYTDTEIMIWNKIPTLEEYLNSGKVEPLTDEQKEKYGIK